MRAFAAVVGIAILLSLYVTVSIAVVLFVSTPLVLIALAGGLLGGVVVGLWRSSLVLSGQVAGVPVRTPQDAFAGRLPGRVRPDSLRRDYAWPQYFAVQVRLDAASVVRAVNDTVTALWSWATQPLDEADTRRVTLFFWPLLLPVAAGLIAVSTGAAAIVGVILTLASMAAAVAWSVGITAVAVLRAADLAWQRVFRANASCPQCYQITDLPAYRCPGPHPPQDRTDGKDLHRDIRPGRLGVWWRRCGCGQRLPTTVLRAAWKLQGCCPTCLHPLRRGSAAARDIRLPVFGAASAGKTHMIMAALTGLVHAHPQQIRIDDEHSQTIFAEYLSLMDSGRSAPRTATATPLAITATVQIGRQRTLVHFFDAAGESLVDPTQNAQLSYLDNARSLIFVVDPFSVEQVRDEAEAAFPETLRQANPAIYDPEDSYNSTVTRLHQFSVATKRQRLAFVVSKADLLRQIPSGVGLGADSDSIQAWLARVGLDNLVIAAGRDFNEVRYFAVSATQPSAGSSLEPVCWLLSSEGVKL